LIKCVAWNSTTCIYAKKLELFQQKSLPFFLNKFFLRENFSYGKALQYLELHALQLRRNDQIFFLNVHTVLKTCPSCLDSTDLCILVNNVRDSLTYSVTHENSPSARCIKAANFFCRNINTFRNSIALLKRSLPLMGQKRTCCCNRIALEAENNFVGRWTSIHIFLFLLSFLVFVSVMGLCDLVFTCLC
jgi:hypothetical protein